MGEQKIKRECRREGEREDQVISGIEGQQEIRSESKAKALPSLALSQILVGEEDEQRQAKVPEQIDMSNVKGPVGAISEGQAREDGP